jgi:hypothetical protein
MSRKVDLVMVGCCTDPAAPRPAPFWLLETTEMASKSLYSIGFDAEIGPINQLLLTSYSTLAFGSSPFIFTQYRVNLGLFSCYCHDRLNIM